MKEFHEVTILPNYNVDKEKMIFVNHDSHGVVFHLETSNKSLLGKRTVIFPNDDQVIIPITTQTITKTLRFDLLFVL